ncbi:MAG: V-type ATP synthase subunit D [Chromatiales bacterium]|jgi:V/A-type H+-transporting ATPase subunit D
MARLALSKSELLRQTRQLKTYERFLPSLDLKRKQLMAERARARKRLADTEQLIVDLQQRVRERLPMLCNREVDLAGLVQLQQVDLAQENLVGVLLPVVRKVHLKVREYGLLAKPHWVDNVVEELSESLRLRIQRDVERRRVALLEEAVRKVTQRVNLFDKVLIPRTCNNIQRIRIHLSDAERAAVVRSKIAKGKRLKEGLA